MLKEITTDLEISTIHEVAEEGILYRGFIAPEKLIAIDNALQEKFCFHHLTTIDGKVGAAMERYSDYTVCIAHTVPVKSIEREIWRITYALSQPAKPWCASLVSFEALDGMTSHKEYSYNRDLVGTLVLKGSLLFGTAKVREETYNAENIVRANAGDLIALKAPSEFSEVRPYFCMFAPEQCDAVRLWMRSPDECRYRKEKP